MLWGRVFFLHLVASLAFNLAPWPRCLWLLPWCGHSYSFNVPVTLLEHGPASCLHLVNVEVQKVMAVSIVCCFSALIIHSNLFVPPHFAGSSPFVVLFYNSSRSSFMLVTAGHFLWGLFIKLFDYNYITLHFQACESFHTWVLFSLKTSSTASIILTFLFIIVACFKTCLNPIHILHENHCCYNT